MSRRPASPSKPWPEQILRALEAIRDGPVGQVQPAGGRAAVAADIEVRLQRLDELVAHPRIVEEWPELPVDDRRDEFRVAQQEPLDAELGHVVDHSTPTDPRGDPQAFLELDHRPSQGGDAVDAHRDRRPRLVDLWGLRVLPSACPR